MRDEDPISFWDEVHAPLGLKSEAGSPSQSSRAPWLALLTSAAAAAALGGAAPAVWRATQRANPSAVARLEAPPPAPEPFAALRAASSDTTPTPPVAAPPPLPTVKPVEADGKAAPGKPDSRRPGPLIINVAEALAAAKLGPLHDAAH